MTRRAHVLVTGAADFIGRHTVAALHHAGHQVTAVDLRPAPTHLTSAARWLRGDFADFALLAEIATGRYRTVVHQAGDRWTWLVLAAHTQLRLARPLAADLRKPWERPAKPGRLTPARVRRGFRRLHGKTPRLSHGFCPVKVKSDSLFGSEDQGGI